MKNIIMPFPMKMKTNFMVIALIVVTLLMSILLFKEHPFLLFSTSPTPQSNENFPTPRGPHKINNVRSSLKVATVGAWE